MGETAHAATNIVFGPFLLDRAAGRLMRDGEALDLPPRPFAVLSHLVGRAGQLVTKDALLDAVWGHRHVSESALKGSINLLRAALGEPAKAPQWIETVPRRGYRFIGATVAGAPANATAPSALGNLPISAAPLLGRDADVAALLALSAGHRLVTLAGSGGVGKTRLALALAALCQREMPDGAWFVRLDAVADGQALAATVARTLQLSAEAARSAESTAAAVSPLSLLLVLDNCEHLLEAVAALAQCLLAQAPGVRLLVTSQEPLHLHGEQVYRLAPLPWPPPDQAARAEDYGAVTLFVHHVRARNPAFVLDDDNRRTVCGLCADLDGLPLALELAAARVPLLGVDGVRARLQERFALLTQGPRDAAPRHRSLLATLEWSHALLSPEQAVVLRRVGVFSGSFSLEAAQAVAADASLSPWAVVDALGALVDKSLLVTVDAALPDARGRRRGDGVAPAPPRPSRRLRMFDSIRSFAAGRLAAAGELPAMRRRQAQWMLDVLVAAARDVHDVPPLEWTARLQPEVDNLRAALRHALEADTALAVALFVHSTVFWHRAGLKHEALRWNDAVRPFADASPLRAGFAQAQGFLCVYAMLGTPSAGVSALCDALRLHHEAGDALNEYFDLFLLSHAILRVQPDADPAGMWERMVALEGAEWGTMRRRYARSVVGVRMRDSGDAAGYRQFCIDEIALHRGAGDRSGIWTWSYGLALAEHDNGRPEAAIALLQSTVQEIREENLLRAHPNMVALLASMLLEQGRPAAYLPAAREAVALMRVNGTLWWMAGALAYAALARRRPEDAARVLGWADALVARRGERAGLFFARLRAGCEERLRQALAEDVLHARRAEGALLEDAAALQLALV